MVRAAWVDSNGLKKGAWSEEEDNKLRAFVLENGHHNWRLLPKYAGLARCGKSCRLRWMNYLKPGVKRGNFTKREEDLIIKLHSKFGNKWSMIASNLPGRTDNDIKNYWNAHIEKQRKQIKKGASRSAKASQNDRVSNADELDPSSHIKLQESYDHSRVDVNSWPDRMLVGGTSYDDHDHLIDCFPTSLIEEGFSYGDGHGYGTEISSSGSSYMSNVFDRINNADDDHDHMTSDQPIRLILDESFGQDHAQNESCYEFILQGEGGFYDPLFDQFYGSFVV